MKPPRPSKPVIGWREWVGLPELGVGWVKAKVDTGARSSSLHAWDVDVHETAGLVRFGIHPYQDDDDTRIEAVAPLVGHREIRSSNGEVELRPVIRTTLLVSGMTIGCELTLTRRDEMGFRMLLGRRTVRRRFLVDPGRSFRGGGDRFTTPDGERHQSPQH